MEFSIKKEIEIEVKENFGITDIDLDEIYSNVESDELMLDMISFCIYTSISEQLKQKGTQNEEVDYSLNKVKDSILYSLKNRGIL